MSTIKNEKNNFFFDNNYKFDLSKEKIILEPNNHQSNSSSTSETFENDIFSDEENIDFNQDFFPQTKEIKLTDMLVDNWQEKIKAFCEDIKKELIIKAINYNYNFSNKK